MSSDRERYVELNKVANEYAMQLGELHAEVKRVLRVWSELDVVGVESMSSEPGREYINAERVQEALSQLERVYRRQHEALDAAESEGVQDQ